MMTLAQADRPFLGTVRSALASERVRFCTHCGIVREEREVQYEHAGLERVCSACGMGILLSGSREGLAGAGLSFLIVTEGLRVSAVSEAAERLFGPESEILGSTLLWLMTSPLGNDELALRVARAAGSERDAVLLPIELMRGHRPSFRRIEARISTCGPPRAALVVIEPTAVNWG